MTELTRPLQESDLESPGLAKNTPVFNKPAEDLRLEIAHLARCLDHGLSRIVEQLEALNEKFTDYFTCSDGSPRLPACPKCGEILPSHYWDCPEVEAGKK